VQWLVPVQLQGKDEVQVDLFNQNTARISSFSASVLAAW
jgi:hypothetical protein